MELFDNDEAQTEYVKKIFEPYNTWLHKALKYSSKADLTANPDEGQIEDIKVTINKMAVDNEYKFNLVSAKNTGEALNHINKYRRDHKLSTFETEEWYERIVSNLLPFGSKGVKEVVPALDALVEKKPNIVGDSNTTSTVTPQKRGAVADFATTSPYMIDKLLKK